MISLSAVELLRQNFHLVNPHTCLQPPTRMRILIDGKAELYAEAESFPITAERMESYEVTTPGMTYPLKFAGQAFTAMHSLIMTPHASWAEVRERLYTGNAISTAPRLYNDNVIGLYLPFDLTGGEEIIPAPVLDPPEEVLWPWGERTPNMIRKKGFWRPWVLTTGFSIRSGFRHGVFRN